MKKVIKLKYENLSLHVPYDESTSNFSIFVFIQTLEKEKIPPY